MRFDSDTEILLIDEHQDYLSNIISALAAEKLVRKGCEAYLAFVSNSGFVKPSVKDIQTVRDFPNVFPEDLLGISPHQEVEFGI